MRERFGRWFPLRAGESRLVLTLGFILFANYAAMGITKVVSVSGFLSEVKGHYILLVWAVDMVLLILATGLQSLFVDRFDRIKLMLGVLVGFGVLYAFLPLAFISTLVPNSISYAMLYLLNDQQWRFFPVVFWILVNDIYDPATGRRMMPFIANFAFFGTILGLGIAALDARLEFGTVNLLWFNALIFLLAYLIGQVRFRKVILPTPTRTQDSMKETLTEGWEFIKTVPAFAYLAFGMLAAGSVMTILLYNVLAEANGSLSGAGFKSFYAAYNLAIAFGSIFIQSISAKIIERFTLRRSFLIQPFIMLGATIANFFVPLYGYMGSAISQGVARVTYDTVDLSARKAFQAMVPNEKRGRVSMFLDSYLPSAGTIIGSLVTFVIIMLGMQFGLERGQYTFIYLGVGVLIVAAAVYAAFRVRATYEQSMLNWQLKRRTRGASVLDKLDFGGGDK
jgi:ATP:ADP antiporter, AAA family